MPQTSSLPQRYFIRLFREFSILIPFFLIALLGANLFAEKTYFDSARNNVLANPNDFSSRLTLAQTLLTTNQLPEARTLLTSLGPHNLTSSETTQLTNVLTEIAIREDSPAKLQSAITNLEALVARYPTYRDGFIKLAILNYRLDRPFLAKKHLASAQALDPNNRLIQEIIRSFEDH